MPLPSIASLSTLKTQSVAFLRTRFLGVGADLAEFLGKFGTSWGMALFGIQRNIESIDRDSPPSTRSSELGITTWGETSGVPSNQGGYGRDGATVATGGRAPLTGTNDTLVEDGQELTGPDGVTLFKLVGDVTIPNTGSFAAVTPGTIGNLAAGTVLTWVTPPAGCDPTVTLSVRLRDGEDQETLDHLFGRIKSRWQNAPKSGADVDYKGWAEEIEGVAEAFTYPNRGGTGTVHVVVTAPGSGTARIPDDDVIDEVQAALDALKPGNVDELIVYAPTMPDDAALTIRASVFLAPNYEWDWDDTSGTWTVVDYTGAGASTTLELSSAIPPSLKAAIDNGDEPLIQIANTSPGASVVPQQIKATAYDVTETILTLEGELDAVPTVGNRVYSGSYAAPLIAQAMLDYIDSLGPSKESGTATDVTAWEDVASVWGSGDAAVQAKDTDDKTRLVSKLSASGGLMIKVGAGAFAATDYAPTDSYPLAPDCARATLVYAVRAVGS